MRYAIALALLLASCGGGGGTATGGLVSDTIEPDPDAPDSADAAIVLYAPGIRAGESVRVRGWAGWGFDEDWYTVNALEAGTVRVTITVDPEPYHLLMAWLWVDRGGPDENAWPTAATWNDDSVELPVEAGQPVHVEVGGWNETGGGYRLTIALLPEE